MRIKALSDIESTNYSETAASNNAATPNGWPESQAPSTVNDCARELMAGTKRAWNRDHVTIASTGSANAYVLTYGTAPASYINGGRYAFRANFANTGSATANVNGLGAKTINQHGGSGLAVLAGGEIQIAHHVTLEYDSTADVLVLVSPSPATSGSLGTMSTQNANAVAITGGTITGITDLAVADGGTGRSTLTAHGVLIGNGTSGVNATTAGTSGQVLTSNGAASDPTFQTLASSSGVVTVKKQTFTASGTYTPSTGMLYCLIEMVGGGAGGGNGNGGSFGAAGGGAGQESRVLATAATIGASQTVTIPAGANSASSGGTVSVGTICTAAGGSAGANGASGFTVGGSGGTGGTSDIATTAQSGDWGSGTASFAAGGPVGGKGGSTRWGSGGKAIVSAGAGTNATGFGSAGGGASGSNNGGTGAQGVVYITEWCSQ